HVVSKIGTAEVPTDPMAIEDADIMIIMKDKDEWTSANNREDLMAKMKKALYPITWAGFEFTQPIQLRFNELMTGAKSDIAVKIFGEDVALLKSKADEAAEHIRKITGAADVKVDQTDGLQQLSVKYDRVRLAQHAVTVDEVNQIIRTAYAGEVVGEVFEQERRYDLVVRLAPDFRQELDLHSLTVTDLHGQQIPLAELSEIREVEGPMLISREQARRFINVGVNVRNRDVAGLVSEIQTVLESELELPPGYEVQYGGAFENLQHATSRLLVAVPIALALIILLLFLAFNSIKETLIIFMAVPLSAVGGIFALWIRDMPFSISSGIGFIALFGVSVLNGIVLISAIKGLKKEDFPDIQALVSYACISRLRPVIMTATVAALGFLPMAISTGSGAEVQRPLATVVIGGLISSTFLTLLVLPTLYIRFNMKNWNIPAAISIVIIMVYPLMGHTQILSTYNDIEAYALTNHPILKNQSLSIQELELNNKVKVNWGPVDILFQNGQINYGGVDNQIEILQDISPLFRFHERSLVKELTESEIKKLEIDQAIERQQWKAELGRAYSNWQFYFHLWKLNKTLIEDIEKSINSLDKQAELGSKDPIELGLMRNSVQAKKQKALLIAQKYRESQNKLRSIAFLPENVVLEPISYEPQTTEKIIRIDSANVFLLELEQRKSVLELSRRLANTQDRQLRVSAGYFGQSLEKDGLFQGFLIGMQIPFDNRENAQRIQKSKLAIEKLDNLKEYTYERLEQQILDLDSELSVLNNSMKVYQENILPLQNELLAKANEQYENGAIDLLEYYQIKEELVDREVEYLELTKKYNDKIIAIEQLNLVKQ
ncbi:MAG: TolC family protein, partial [Flavobacteriales bacterium]|nr:TolC family protein [Flavobacteriales bacterium]